MKSIQAGDTFSISFCANYDASIYTPKLLLNNGVNKYEKVGSGDFIINIPAIETADYPPGEYAYSIVLFTSDERITVESGFTNVIADLVTDGASTKNKFKIIVDAIDASVLGVATTAQKQTAINGRSIERFSPEELIVLRDKYAKLAKIEDRNIQGKPSAKKVYIRL